MKKIIFLLILSHFFSVKTFASIVEIGKCFWTDKSYLNFDYKWTPRGHKLANSFYFNYISDPYIFNNERWIVREMVMGTELYWSYKDEEIKKEFLDAGFYPVKKYSRNVLTIDTQNGMITHLEEWSDEHFDETLKHYGVLKNTINQRGKNPKDDQYLGYAEEEAISKRRKKSEITKYVITDYVGGIINAYKFGDENYVMSDRYGIRVDLTTLSFEKEMMKNLGQDSSYSKGVFLCTDNLYANTDENDDNSKGAGSSGTAFFVSNKGHLLTNNHVVEGCSISKITYKNKDYDTQLIATDKTLDLALLKAELRPQSFFNFSKNNIKKLNKVYVAGYPLGKGLSDDLKISSGIVSSLKGFQDNSNEIQIDAPINPGNSGGPIINENGDLIAIAVSGLAKDQTEGINFGIKSSAAELFLRSNKVTPKKAMYSRIKDNDKLLEILEQGTVYTYCD